MSEQPDQCYFEYDFNKLPNLHKFAHQAMATVFEIFIAYPDAGYARKAAQAAFAECDRLEQQLSRFVPNSDVSRINDSTADAPVIIGLDALDCIAIAYETWRKTWGAFDISVAPLVDCYFDDKRKPQMPTLAQIQAAKRFVGMDFLQIDWLNRTVRKNNAAVAMDLGGIGKGYAVDKMQQVLQHWEITRAFIHGGQSSATASDAPDGVAGWPVTFRHPIDHTTICVVALKDKALSGSGLEKQNHIVDPVAGRAVTEHIAAWSCASSAAYADSLSTAFMVMSMEQIDRFCETHADIGAIVATHKNISRFNSF
jgi:FAD:protein FMN transferase